MSFRQKKYCIADLNIILQWPTSLKVLNSKRFNGFLTTEESTDLKINLTEVSQLLPLYGSKVYQTSKVAVYRDGNRFTKLFFDTSGSFAPYASAQYDWKNGISSMLYLADAKEYLGDVTNVFRHVGFEELMLSRGRLILHSSLVETSRGGLLFSGVSGIGKSTQANLWHRYEGSRIINGDRPILYQAGDCWQASGSPYAGSSQYFINKSVPIFAILLLEQGEHIELRRMTGAEAFQRLYAGTVVNTWDRKYVSRACDLLADLIARVPVYRFCCTPDQEAVSFLKKELF